MIICLGTTPAKQRTMTFASLNVDAVNRARSVTESASGKVINVARVLRALSAPAIATGFLGGDAGAFTRRDMDAVGIAHDFVSVDVETRTCVTVVDESAGTATELIEEARRVERSSWDALLAKLDQLIGGSNAKILVLSGTLAPGGSDDFYAECVRRASHAGVRSIVDASGQPLNLALNAKPFIVKPNRTELGKTLGATVDSDASLRDAMKRTIDRGPAWVVVTLGGDGVVASDGQSFWRVRSPKVEVVNPIGSGDSFAAGLAASLLRGNDVPESLLLATACGVANAMTSIAGHVHAEDVERLMRSLRVESWN